MNRVSLKVLLLLPLIGSVFVAGCAGLHSYSGYGLQSGLSTRQEVVASMGPPAMQWTDADGREQLAYPRGPAGTQTFMAYLDAHGRLERIEGVLDSAHFARIQAGKSDKADVLRLLGPPQPQWTAYFEARDELAWEWRFCDDWNQVARFDVLFDASSGIVRSTLQRPDEHLPDPWGRGRQRASTCSH